ncbi:putative virion structural protein [Pseudomonas phage OBP]|uniref:putative virion structural protein n=1 Tax=Pseudomonas phage OBP TaxID=1124849 RepID=UPI000240D606|nr:putative virion structural protein [Pseudomonas phage OBP]AEV89446.1 putative virion structural protein [Pseudomonas phage OBP]
MSAATDRFKSHMGGLVKYRFLELTDEEKYERAMSDVEMRELLAGLEGKPLTDFFAPAIPPGWVSGFESAANIPEYWSGLEALPANFNYNRDNAVKDIFDNLVEDLEITPRWVQTLRRYVYGFATKDNDHTEFFGSPYLGTHRVLFKTSDRVTFFRDIIDVDEVRLRDELIKTKWINKDFKVSSEAFNLSIIYLMNRVWNSNLPSNMKNEALINLVMLFHYRVMTSIMNHYFGYLVKQNVAITAYNKLSLKFDIKRYGSWNDLFRARGEFIIDPRTGIHFDAFAKMDNDKKIVYMVNDMESRLKGVINDYTKVLYEIKDSVDLVETDSGLALLDGELNIKDVQKSANRFKNYIANVLNDKNSFFKQELATYAAKAIPRTDADKLESILKDFPAQYAHAKGDKYREFVDDVTTHLFEYISANGIKHQDVKHVFFKIRGAYTSSKSSNALLLKLRAEGDEIVKAMTGIKTEIKITSLRTSLMLYIVLRTLIMESKV